MVKRSKGMCVKTACLNLYQTNIEVLASQSKAGGSHGWRRDVLILRAIFTQAFNIGAGCHCNIFLLSESLLGPTNSWCEETGLDFKMTTFFDKLSSSKNPAQLNLEKLALVYTSNWKLYLHINLFWGNLNLQESIIHIKLMTKHQLVSSSFFPRYYNKLGETHLG